MKKKLLTIALGVFTVLGLYAQDTIWIEDFNYIDSTKSSIEGPGWSILDDDKPMVLDSQLVWKTSGYGARRTLQTGWFSLDSLYDITWSFWVGGTTSNSSDQYHFILEHKDGVQDTLAVEYGSVSDENPNGVLFNTAYDSARVVLKADPRTRYYIFDSILFTGTKRTHYPKVTFNLQNASGVNLDGIEIEIERLGTFVSDVDGNIDLPEDLGAPFDESDFVVAEKPDGYQPYYGSLALDVDAQDTTIAIVLDEGYDVTFDVVAEGSADPIEGATVSFGAFDDSLTAADGAVTYYDLPNQTDVHYVIVADGYDFYTDSLTINDADVNELVTLLRAYNVTLVALEEDGTGISDMEFDLNGHTATTDYTGQATIEKIRPQSDMPWSIHGSAIFGDSTGSISVVDADVIDTVYLSMTNNKVIWFESFNHPNGTKIDTLNTAWTILDTTEDFSTQEGVLSNNDYDNQWMTEVIKIDSIAGKSIPEAQFSIDISDGGDHFSDSFAIAYRVDGGDWTTIHDGGVSQDLLTLTETVSGSTLEIMAYVHSNTGGRQKFIHQVLVEVVTTTPVANIIPENAATAIALDSVVVVSFDQPVFNTGGSEITDPAALITFKEEDTLGVDVAFTATINDAKDSITVTPSAALSNGQYYYVAVEGFENQWSDEGSLKESTFRTLMVAPEMLSVTPVNGATDVAVDVDITALFSQAVSIAVPAGIAVKDAANEDAAISPSASDSTITINAMMGNGETYTVTIAAEAIQNEDGIGNADEITWSFTTIMSTPAMESTTPVNGATDVLIDEVNITLTFDQDVTVLDLSGVTISDGTDNVSGVSANLAGRVLSVSHDALEKDITYTVTVPAGAVENVGGIANDEIAWSFTTESPVSIDIIKANAMAVYPNPATNYIIVEAAEESVITIYNSLGIVMETVVATSNETTIDVAAFSSSVIIVEVENNTAVVTKRIIVE